MLAWDTEGWPGDGAAYQVAPPVGGPHNEIWMNAGVYTKPVPAERAVHNLEHGAVWITYNPDVPTAQVKALTAFVSKQSYIPEKEQAPNGDPLLGQANRYDDFSPWSSNALPSPIMISAWGHQLRVNTPTDPRLQRFVDVFRHSPKYTPEYGAAVDGIPVQTGGRPALDGSKIADPAGSAQQACNRGRDAQTVDSRQLRSVSASQRWPGRPKVESDLPRLARPG